MLKTFEIDTMFSSEKIPGILQLTLGLIFFITCSVTSTAVRHHKELGLKILCSLIGTFLYLCLVLITVIVGIIGFYRVMQMYSRVDYVDRSVAMYVDQNLYRAALTVFTFHIWFSVSKCCCCR
ncbi:unnamed protein product [Anisakis simplex]|uniref:Conserved plasma membrane protein n=1 Tax=Anisakis simplex TaxID=6269 RepID=A0A0M3J735_ANISI|nr:unnamed protein product [Anisakis simplex]VDK22896.1 unnamed protein product [Anisakis simplex]